MPRHARKKSITGIYHIMLRGIDKRDIFLDDEDKNKFINSIIKAKEASNFQLYAYCLMDNHVHILIKENEEIGTSIKRITVSYVGWHNKKYERVGHLFQNRYLSEPVESDGYFLTVLRYIHQNPLKAKMVSNTADYKWSSYGHYYQSYNGQDTFIDGDLARNYFSLFKEFAEFMNISNDDECLEYKKVVKYNDSTLKDKIVHKYSIDNIDELSINEKCKIIKEIYYENHTSIRQLSRIFSLGKTIVEKALKKDR